MLKLYFFKDKNKIIKFQGIGHSNFNKSGYDIVCSAISALSQYVVIGLTQHLQLSPEIKIEDGFISIDLLNSNIKKRENEIDILFSTLFLTCCEIEKLYPKNIKIIEREVKVNV